MYLLPSTHIATRRIHVMAVSHFDTEEYTKSCYNAFESRELYFNCNCLEMSNYSNWNYCSDTENIHDINNGECFFLTQPTFHTPHPSTAFDPNQRNDILPIMGENLMIGVGASIDEFNCPIDHIGTSSFERLYHPYEKADNFDYNR